MAAPDLIGMRDRIRVVPDSAQQPSVTTLRIVTASGEVREVSHDTSVRRHGLDTEWGLLVAKLRASSTCGRRPGVPQVLHAEAHGSARSPSSASEVCRYGCRHDYRRPSSRYADDG